jgi:ketosteroid isomerase-like protein
MRADTDDVTSPDDMHAGQADAEGAMEQIHVALGAFFLGDPRPTLDLFSHGEDVTLGNPFGPFVRGWERVAAVATEAATHYRDGEAVGFDRIATYASGDLASFVEVERYRVRIGGRDEVSPVTLRVSTLLRREADGWRIASRHADPITAARPAESVIAEG